MKGAALRQMLKPWMLPIAMLTGILFHGYIHHIAFLTPYLIFLMLLITFCRIDPRHIAVDGMSVRLLAVQLLMSLALYFALVWIDPVLAQGAFICVFCPTATAAPVVTGMLGGSVPRLVTYSLVSNITVALTAPLAFTMMNAAEMDFLGTAAAIGAKVAPLILLPLVVAMVMKKALPRLHGALSSHQGVSFYVWAVSLVIVVGNSVSFIMAEPSEALWQTLWLAAIAGAACALQFGIGRVIGSRAGDKIAGAQGLGQKNTVLAIWMAMTYLNPLSSVAPAAYVAWQNTVNSLQLYLKQKRALTAPLPGAEHKARSKR
ncbi:MAG: transporter [Firmicutes bacterium]|nr:transporter [Bacillota bacterium]MCM1401501.1 transporter [Bacteroides sp.]MCM1477351.1 transporter [Bacteroides sp.]